MAGGIGSHSNSIKLGSDLEGLLPMSWKSCTKGETSTVANVAFQLRQEVLNCIGAHCAGV